VHESERSDETQPDNIHLGNYSIKNVYGVRFADTTPRLGNNYIIFLLLQIIFTKTKKILIVTHYSSIFLEKSKKNNQNLGYMPTSVASCASLGAKRRDIA
jgi:hypothetical protein